MSDQELSLNPVDYLRYQEEHLTMVAEAVVVEVQHTFLEKKPEAVVVEEILVVLLDIPSLAILHQPLLPSCLDPMVEIERIDSFDSSYFDPFLVEQIRTLDVGECDQMLLPSVAEVVVTILVRIHSPWTTLD